MVNGIRRDFSAQAHVIIANLHTPVGRDIADLYELETVPGFVVFAGDGELRLRSEGKLQSRKSLRAALQNV